MSVVFAASASISATAAPAEAAETGRIAGRVSLGSLTAPAPAFDPYPGRAGARVQAAPAPNEGGVSDVVLYVEQVAGTFSPRAKRSSLVQEGMRFVPRVLPILVGEEVDFPNRDPYYHNVFSYSDTRRFDLGKYAEGGSRRVEFPEVGEVRVFCDIHADMNAVILVLQNPFFTQPESDGSFAIEAVPAGPHVLIVWHPDSDPKRIEVTVPSEGAQVLEVGF
jgi:plastocyanin